MQVFSLIITVGTRSSKRVWRGGPSGWKLYSLQTKKRCGEKCTFIRDVLEVVVRSGSSYKTMAFEMSYRMYVVVTHIGLPNSGPVHNSLIVTYIITRSTPFHLICRIFLAIYKIASKMKQFEQRSGPSAS